MPRDTPLNKTCEESPYLWLNASRHHGGKEMAATIQAERLSLDSALPLDYTVTKKTTCHINIHLRCGLFIHRLKEPRQLLRSKWSREKRNSPNSIELLDVSIWMQYNLKITWNKVDTRRTRRQSIKSFPVTEIKLGRIGGFSESNFISTDSRDSNGEPQRASSTKAKSHDGMLGLITHLNL